MDSVSFYKPKEHTSYDGTRFVEKIPGHYVVFIPNDIQREDIINQISHPSKLPESKKKNTNPNRVHNSFILYRMKKTKEITRNNPTLNQTVVSKMIGRMWKDEPVEVKKNYKAKSELLKQRSKRMATFENAQSDNESCIRVEFQGSQISNPQKNSVNLSDKKRGCVKANKGANMSINGSEGDVFPIYSKKVKIQNIGYGKESVTGTNLTSQNQLQLKDAAINIDSIHSFDCTKDENKRLSEFRDSSLGKHRRSISKPIIESMLSEFLLNYKNLAAETPNFLLKNKPYDFLSNKLSSQSSFGLVNPEDTATLSQTENIISTPAILPGFYTESLASGTLGLPFYEKPTKFQAFSLGYDFSNSSLSTLYDQPLVGNLDSQTCLTPDYNPMNALDVMEQYKSQSAKSETTFNFADCTVALDLAIFNKKLDEWQNQN